MSHFENQYSFRTQRVVVWLWMMCFMVILMVVIGGITRLTGSGLSIVEWKPLMGAIPPLTHSEWLEVFVKYQNSPQGQLVNQGMTLPEFQWIFFWEYFHRLIGRTLGVVFLFPWIFFWIKGYFERRWAGKFLFGFMLGGLQGLMGWVMVASGLVDRPHVSHYRLAAHLLLALFILCYFWRMAWAFAREGRLSIAEIPRSDHRQTDSIFERAELKDTQLKTLRSLNRALNGLLGLLLVQIFYGALVAGLRAGFMSNTFPDMDGQFFPRASWLFPSWIQNIFESPLVVQWMHRTLGWSLFLTGLIVCGAFRKNVPPSIQKIMQLLGGMILMQFLLGVFTLLFHVPLGIAIAHQLGASFLLLCILWLRWEVSHLIMPDPFTK